MSTLTRRAGMTALAASLALTMAPITAGTTAGAMPLMPTASGPAAASGSTSGSTAIIQAQGERLLRNRPGARTDNAPQARQRTPQRDGRNWDRNRDSRNWDRNRHGPRYRDRRRGYTHYHDGYYYATPWWVAAGALGAFIGGQVQQQGGGERAHDDWCDQRYRSYDRRTNTFMGYDGKRHYCNSLYDNR